MEHIETLTAELIAAEAEAVALAELVDYDESGMATDPAARAAMLAAWDRADEAWFALYDAERAVARARREAAASLV